MTKLRKILPIAASTALILLLMGGGAAPEPGVETIPLTAAESAPAPEVPAAEKYLATDITVMVECAAVNGALLTQAVAVRNHMDVMLNAGAAVWTRPGYGAEAAARFKPQLQYLDDRINLMRAQQQHIINIQKEAYATHPDILKYTTNTMLATFTLERKLLLDSVVGTETTPAANADPDRHRALTELYWQKNRICQDRIRGWLGLAHGQALN